MKLPPITQLFDEEKRGAKAPDYSPAEYQYRNDRFNELQMSYKIREMTHMELNDMTYSQYYLINRQQDMAYNPPKRNAADVRMNSGIIHEKDNTILSILMDMNFQPKVRIYDNDDQELIDAGTVLTAMLKKSLIQDNFQQKVQDIFRTNIAQGNVFVEERPYVKVFSANKVQTNKTDDPSKVKWNTIVEQEEKGCTSVLIPNTGVFLSNILEPDLNKQPRIYIVMHIPIEEVASIYKDFDRWESVPKYPTRTVPVNIDGVWGDYFLQQPQDKYAEVIMMQSEIYNEANVWVNGTMMYPVQEENGVITGFPLTYFSPSGKYTIVKGDNETIPFFAYGRSVPSKNTVKEETMNELMRLMVYKMRQAAKPPVGNNSPKVLQANIWDPGMITPDIDTKDLSILTPNAGITNADFSFYKLIQDSIADTSVAASLEGGGETDITATQYVSQKKEALKKLGLSIDQSIYLLKKMFWLRLYNHVMYLSKKKQYNANEDKIIEAFEDFSIDDYVDGKKGKIRVKFTDTNVGRDTYSVMKDDMEENVPTKTLYVRPDYIKNLVKNLKDKMYIDVISEPEGKNQSMLAILMNLLTQYTNLRQGNNQTVNWDYLEKIIEQNSGFDEERLFIPVPPPQPMIGQVGPDGQPINPQSGAPGQPSPAIMPVNNSGPSSPKTPQNRVLATMT